MREVMLAHLLQTASEEKPCQVQLYHVRLVLENLFDLLAG